MHCCFFLVVVVSFPEKGPRKEDFQIKSLLFQQFDGFEFFDLFLQGLHLGSLGFQRVRETLSLSIYIVALIFDSSERCVDALELRCPENVLKIKQQGRN